MRIRNINSRTGLGPWFDDGHGRVLWSNGDGVGCPSFLLGGEGSGRGCGDVEGGADEPILRLVEIETLVSW